MKNQMGLTGVELRYGCIRNSVNFPAMEMTVVSDYRIVILNKNITNMVGQVTAVLAGEGLNIEHMLNRSKGSWACTIIDVDRKPSQETLAAINAIDGVVRVRVI